MLLDILNINIFPQVRQNKYGKSLISEKGICSLSPLFKSSLENEIFRNFTEHSIDYGLLRYMNEFGYKNYGYPFLKALSNIQ